MRHLVFISAVLSGISLFANASGQEINGPHLIRVGLTELWGNSHLQVQPIAGAFEWLDGSGEFFANAEGLQSIRAGNSTLSGPNGKNSPYWILRPVQPASVLRVITAQGDYLKFVGILHFWIEQGKLHVILESPVEDYLPGVVVSESGKGHRLEFYEVQSIVSRTYSVRTMGKHRMEGFDVCDQTHCQVFKGIQTVNDTIRLACRSTENLILLDRLGQPADAAFHSNCGGKTRSAVDVWQSDAHYLTAIRDSFCLAEKHAQWTKEIPMTTWKNWTMQQQNLDPEGIKLAARRSFALPSANFEIRPKEQVSSVTSLDPQSTIVLLGRGFGHGVGLCQEGSMSRAESNHSTWQILLAYYRGIRIGVLP